MHSRAIEASELCVFFASFIPTVSFNNQAWSKFETRQHEKKAAQNTMETKIRQKN